MKQLTILEKFAIVVILSRIMRADGIIHPKEEEYMNKVYAELGIAISDMEDITNLDYIQAMSIVNKMEKENKEYACSLFITMSMADGYIHPLEKLIIDQFHTTIGICKNQNP